MARQNQQEKPTVTPHQMINTSPSSAKYLSKGLSWDPYGKDAECLTLVQGMLQHYSAAVIAAFYQSLMVDDSSAQLLDLLSVEENAQLRHSQASYLRLVLSPTLTREMHASMARETGLRHNHIGLPAETLSQSFQIYRTTLEKMLYPEIENRTMLRTLIMERLNNDQSWQLMAYTEAESQRSSAMEDLGLMLNEVANLGDLIQGILDRIIGIPGIVGTEIITIDNNLHTECALSLGKSLYVEVTQQKDHRAARSANSESTLLRAWQTESPVRMDSMQKEGELSPRLRTCAAKKGIRSWAIYPIQDSIGAPQFLLSLYSAWPGYFRSGTQQSFWYSLKRQIGNQVDLIKRSSLIKDRLLTPQKDRQRYRQLLQGNGLEMWYQPIVNPATQRVVKVEALARLRDGDRIVSPYHFLPAFGSAQLALLFEKGLDHVYHDAQRWAIEGIFPEGVSINMPPVALQDANFIQHLAAWGMTHLPSASTHPPQTPVHITLEILETDILDEAMAYEQIDLLRRSGFRIALDDVGSGESSLRRLRTLPIDEIKIDQSFIRSLDTNLDVIRFVSVLVDLADDLHLRCVAEGVENAIIADMVASVGHPLLQGYHYAKPMPHEEIAPWLANHEFSEKPIYPHTLQGWYSQLVVRQRIIRSALSQIPSMLDIAAIQMESENSIREFLRILSVPEGPENNLLNAHDLYFKAALGIAEKSPGAEKKGDSFAFLDLAGNALRLCVYDVLGIQR